MPIRIAQFGTKHGHAAGKFRAMQENPDVEVTGLYEPDPAAREQASQRAPYQGARLYQSVDEILNDASVTAIAIEGRNDESLAQARQAIDAGKHVWYDKPAGDDWAEYLAFANVARAKGRLVQMGYMFRYGPGWRLVGDFVRSGLLGDVFSVRAHMSTSITVEARQVISGHRGGIFYDLSGHVIDQIVWLLGRPTRVTTFFRNDATPSVPAVADNTLGILEFDRAMATIDIAAMETSPMFRRFEVYGTRGSAVMEPFDDVERVHLNLADARDGYQKGRQIVPVEKLSRQQLYERELDAFVRTLRDGAPPDRPFEHEFTVQETLLRATGGVPGQ